MSDFPKTYTISQAADALGCSATFIRKKIDQRELPCYKLGGTGLMRVYHEDLLDLFQRVNDIPGSRNPMKQAG